LLWYSTWNGIRRDISGRSFSTFRRRENKGRMLGRRRTRRSVREEMGRGMRGNGRRERRRGGVKEGRGIRTRCECK
jgi:hypothetical protein